MKVMYIGHSRNLYNLNMYVRKHGQELKTAVGDSFSLSDIKEDIMSFEPEIIFADIPRNPTGKIEKPKLRQMYSVEQLVARENEG